MERYTVASLKLYCKQVPTKTNDITIPIIPFGQQLSSLILLILFRTL